MDGFSWDDENQCITESNTHETNPPLPMLHMLPKHNFIQKQNNYHCPLYKTSERRGVISTTGNFIRL